MKRTYQLFGLSFMDILIAALGSILFMFIVVDKGHGAVNSEVPGGPPKVFLNVDTTKGLFSGLDKYDTLNIKLGQPIIVYVNKFTSVQKEPCPSVEIPKCDCDEGILCPDPKHHKLKVCPDPSCHTPKKSTPNVPKPVVCNKIHCNDSACKTKTVTVYKGDPIEIPYKIGFSVNDLTSIERDIDLKVCKGNTCVFSIRKNQGWIRWLDLNKTGIFKPGVVTGGEIIIADKISSGDYTIYAKYDKRRNKNDPPSTTIRLTVASKIAGRIKHESREVELIKEDGWKQISIVSIDPKGNISKLIYEN